MPLGGILPDYLPILKSVTLNNIYKVPFVMEYNIFRDSRIYSINSLGDHSTYHSLPSGSQRFTSFPNAK